MAPADGAAGPAVEPFAGATYARGGAVMPGATLSVFDRDTGTELT